MSPFFTIVILDYFKAEQVLQNVLSLMKQKIAIPYNIIIIDNSCSKQNADVFLVLKKYRNIRIIINKENKGYTKAHNDIQSLIQGKYVLIVNPDIDWKKNPYVIQKMYEYMESNSRVGILGPKQKTEKDIVEMNVRPFPKLFVQIARRTRLRNIPGLSHLVKQDEQEHYNVFRVKEVDWLQSSCIFIRKDFWDKVGGFDERYYIFMADVELCFQAWKHGYKVVYYPEVCVYADGKRASSGSLRNVFNNWVLRQHFVDACKYHWKHLFEKSPRK